MATPEEIQPHNEFMAEMRKYPIGTTPEELDVWISEVELILATFLATLHREDQQALSDFFGGQQTLRRGPDAAEIFRNFHWRIRTILYYNHGIDV